LKTIEFSFWQLGQVNRILYPDRDPFTVVLMEVFIIIPYLRDAFHENGSISHSAVLFRRDAPWHPRDDGMDYRFSSIQKEISVPRLSV
jgi:hypothetical protein